MTAVDCGGDPKKPEGNFCKRNFWTTMMTTTIVITMRTVNKLILLKNKMKMQMLLS